MPGAAEGARATHRCTVATKLFQLSMGLVVAASAACAPGGRDIHDAFNSRETGPYLAVGRTLGQDGSLLVHVVASKPAHAEEIARHIVQQNLAASPPSLRVVVDPAGHGARQVFRWDQHGLQPDSSREGLPPAPRAEAHGPSAGH